MTRIRKACLTTTAFCVKFHRKEPHEEENQQQTDTAGGEYGERPRVLLVVISLRYRLVKWFRFMACQIGHSIANGLSLLRYFLRCFQGTKPRRWTPPIVTSFTAILRV